MPAASFEAFRATYRAATTLWYRGHGVAAAAVAPTAHDAAQWSRWLALQYLARAAVGAASGTFEGADRFERHYRAMYDRFAAELERRIADHVRRARVVASGVARSSGMMPAGPHGPS